MYMEGKLSEKCLEYMIDHCVVEKEKMKMKLDEEKERWRL